MIWGHFGTPFPRFSYPFLRLTNDRFFNAFWDAFWMDFGGPDPRKWSSRLSETLILLNSPFSPQGRYLMENGALKAPKTKLKSMKNRLKNLMKTLLGFGWVSGGFFVDFGGVVGTLDLQKWVCGVGDVFFFSSKNLISLTRFGFGAIFQ